MNISSEQMNYSQRVADAFSKAAPIYVKEAKIQNQVSESLLEWLEPKTDRLRVLDLGCGPGSCYDLVKAVWPHSEYTGIDIAPGMIEQAKLNYPEADWLVADMQSLPFADASFDLIVSSSSMQWLHNLMPVFKESQRLLKPGGEFWFGLYIDGTLGSLKEAWSRIDNLQHVNDFMDAGSLFEELTQAGFEVNFQQQQLIKQPFEHVLDLLRSIKTVGANQVERDNQGARLTKRTLDQLQYELSAIQKGEIEAEYETLFVHAVKPES